MNKRARMIIPAALAIVAVLVYFAAFHEREASGKLLVSGNIEVTDAQLSFKIPGRLLERLVDEGETVGAGDLIAKLESIDQQLAVKQAEANLSYAQAVLAEIKAGSRPEDIARVRAQVEQARSAAEDLEIGSRAQEIANARAQLDRALAGSKAALSQLELAEAEYNRYSELYAEGVISLSEFERVESQHETAASSYEEAQAAVESAREGLSLWEEGARPERIEQARAALRQAEAAYALVVAGPRAETIEQAQAQVNIAKEALNQAKQLLAYTELHAPFSGVILSKAAEPGEYFNPGSPVVTMGNLDKVWLRAYISETDLSRIDLGRQVEVTTDSYPGKVYEGRISFISSEAEFTPKAVQTAGERVKLVYLIKIVLDNPNRELKPGMPADCTIQLAE